MVEPLCMFTVQFTNYVDEALSDMLYALALVLAGLA